MASIKRYKINKDQLERVVENFVMEAASIESKKAPVKNHIPAQGAEAKKHVKNKISGKIVEPSEGTPKPSVMKKKLPQASDAKKHISKAKATHSTKARVVKEHRELIEEGFWDKVKEFMGTGWDEEKAKAAYQKVYVRNAQKMAQTYANGNVDDFKKAVIEFMKKNGGYPVLGGNGKNAQWDESTKTFKRQAGKLGGGNYGQVGG